jgi:hypothetical protein
VESGDKFTVAIRAGRSNTFFPIINGAISLVNESECAAYRRLKFSRLIIVTV